MNSIDKFGRRGQKNTSLRGPPGVGFKLTNDNNYDMQGKRIKNLGNPEEDNDCITRQYLENYISIISTNMLKAFEESADIKAMKDSIKKEINDMRNSITDIVNQKNTLSKQISILNQTVSRLQQNGLSVTEGAAPVNKVHGLIEEQENRKLSEFGRTAFIETFEKNRIIKEFL